MKIFSIAALTCLENNIEKHTKDEHIEDFSFFNNVLIKRDKATSKPITHLQKSKMRKNLSLAFGTREKVKNATLQNCSLQDGSSKPNPVLDINLINNIISKRSVSQLKRNVWQEAQYNDLAAKKWSLNIGWSGKSLKSVNNVPVENTSSPLMQRKEQMKDKIKCSYLVSFVRF